MRVFFCPRRLCARKQRFKRANPVILREHAKQFIISKKKNNLCRSEGRTTRNERWESLRCRGRDWFRNYAAPDMEINQEKQINPLSLTRGSTTHPIRSSIVHPITPSVKSMHLCVYSCCSTTPPITERNAASHEKFKNPYRRALWLSAINEVGQQMSSTANKRHHVCGFWWNEPFSYSSWRGKYFFHIDESAVFRLLTLLASDDRGVTDSESTVVKYDVDWSFMANNGLFLYRFIGYDCLLKRKLNARV